MKTKDPNANLQTLSASGNVAAALSLLSETLGEEQKRINNEGSKAILADDFETAKSVIDFAERLLAFQQKAATLAGEWKALEEHRDTFTAKVEEIVAKGFFGRAGKGEITPDHAYCPYILQALIKMGGKAPAKVIKKMVRESMNAILKPADDTPTNSPGKPIRWQVGCGYARKLMVGENDGRMVYRKDGIWEISDKGRMWLAEQNRGK